MATNVLFETGDNLDETNFQLVADAITCDTSYVISGGAISDGGGVDFDMTACVAVVNGYYVSADAVTAQALATSDVNYVWLESDGTVTDNVTGAAPSTGAILLGIVTTDGSSVTAITHRADTDEPAATMLTGGLNVFRIKGSDESATSDTTLSADSDLTFTAAVREKWHLEYLLVIDQAGATADFQCRVAIPSGGVTSMAMGPDSDLSTSATTGSGDAGIGAYDHTNGVNGATHQIEHLASNSSEIPVHVVAIVEIGETGGSVNLEWSQITSSASATTVKAGSTLLATRILG